MSGSMSFTKITKAGKVNPWLEVTFESVTKDKTKKGTDMYKLLFNNGKSSKILALAFANNGKGILERLEIGQSYIIKGDIKAQTKSRKYSSSSTSRFDLWMGKIEIKKRQPTKSPQASTSRQNQQVINIDYVKNKLKPGKQCTLKNVTIEDGTVYRYFGCEICTKKIPCLNENKKYFCPSCPKKSGEKKRKICMMVKHVILKDDSGELDEVVGFNKMCVSLLGKEGSLFLHDMEPQDAFRRIFGSSLEITLSVQKKMNVITGCEEVFYVIQRIVYDVNTVSVTPQFQRDLDPEIPNGVSNSVGQIDSTAFPQNEAESTLTILEVKVQRREKFLDIRKNLNRSPYVFKSEPKGLALIINNINFPNEEMKRDGSKVDVGYMQKLWPQLGYETILHEDVKTDEIQTILVDFKNKLVSGNVSSSVVVIMSHGNSNEVDMADGKKINVWTDLVYKFSNDKFPQFEGKPKLFFVATCQTFQINEAKSAMPFCTNVSDVLVCLSSLPGQYSIRDVDNGTRFIHHLTNVFMEFAQGNEIRKLLDLIQEQMNSFCQFEKQVCIWKPILFADFVFFEHSDENVAI